MLFSMFLVFKYIEGNNGAIYFTSQSSVNLLTGLPSHIERRLTYRGSIPTRSGKLQLSTLDIPPRGIDDPIIGVKSTTQKPIILNGNVDYCSLI